MGEFDGTRAYQQDVQDRIDESMREPTAEESMGSCAHRQACVRAWRMHCGDGRACDWCKCDECFEWE